MKRQSTAIIVTFVLAITGLISCKEGYKVEDYHSEVFGENVFIFTPKDDPKNVQQVLDDIYKKQEAAQFENERYAVYFMPGKYSSEIQLHIGFYMHAAGLGFKPSDTKINKMDCLARWIRRPNNNNATCNFWREVENLEFMTDTVWAVSQATSLRRTIANGDIHFHDEGGWCSGGFSADSVFHGISDSGSQQQWLSRNNEYEAWNGANWNIVMMGDNRKQALEAYWPEKAFTEIEKTPLVREKPFLVYDSNKGYGVFVPDFRKESSGISWKKNNSGKFISLDKFFVAKPGDSISEINDALKNGKNLFLTPGIYRFAEPVKVVNKDTIVLGTGLATIIPTDGNECIITADEDGIIIAGILFDAGQKKSENLLLVGEEKTKKNHSENPISLSDLYFRVGGTDTETPVKAECCLTINSSNVICDNFWVWRADHGKQVGWDLNECDYGIVVNGNDVFTYALMVEHFKKNETVWNGERGKIYMYQCEIPYDVPSQDVWMSHNNSKKGYASIMVSDGVKEFDARGIGIYLLNRHAEVTLESPVEVPDTPGVRIENVCTVMIGGFPGMNAIVNDKGSPVLRGVSREVLTEYCNGQYK